MRVLFLEARLEWKQLVVAFLVSMLVGWALAAAGGSARASQAVAAPLHSANEQRQADELNKLAARNRRLEALVDVLQTRTESTRSSEPASDRTPGN